GFNSLVHSLRALSTLRRSGLRIASAAAKPCQGDSSELYLITGRIPDGSELGSELTLLAGSELKTSELDTSELKTSEYRFLKIFILASYEQELWGRFVTAVKLNRGLRDSNYDQLCSGLVGELQNKLGYANPSQCQAVKCYKQAMENGVALDEEQLLFIAADDCDAFDFDVDEAPTAQTMFMVNLSSTYPIYDKVDPSYDSNVLSEVHDNDHYQDAVCKHHEIHEMHDDVQPNYVNNVSSVPNDAYMMILNDMHELLAQYVSVTTQNNVVAKSLTAELTTYKEQVKLYERRAMFELTEREQKIDEQLRIVITNCNIKKEILKKELHSVKLQLSSTINHNKSMVEEVTSLKKDFKQKENKYLKEFFDMKSLKERVDYKLYKQDQSLQTVHMLCKPKPYYDKKNKVAIGYKNPLSLTRAKQVQPALYNGHEIIKTNHVPVIMHNSEDTLEIDEITRKKMNNKMKDPECMKKRVKIAPPDYSREKYLATFTPQKQLTPEQIFWSNDLIEMKAKALKE
ncbi:hypothetical protein Tco_1429232, partial [Tanacetum coccineum]